MRVCLYMPDGRRMVGDIPAEDGNPPLGIVWGEITFEFFCLNGMGVCVYKTCNDVLTPTHHLTDDEWQTFKDFNREKTEGGEQQ